MTTTAAADCVDTGARRSRAVEALAKRVEILGVFHDIHVTLQIDGGGKVGRVQVTYGGPTHTIFEAKGLSRFKQTHAFLMGLQWGPMCRR
jgi:hypothetical protein